MTGTICRAGPAYPSGALSSTSVLRGVRVARTLVFRIVLCISWFGHCGVCPSN